MMVPNLGSVIEGSTVFRKPLGDENAFGLGDDYCIADAASVPSFVSHEQVFRRLQEWRKGLEGIYVRVEIDAAFFVQDFKAQNISLMGEPQLVDDIVGSF